MRSPRSNTSEFRKLVNLLQAIAQAPEVQVAAFPPFVCVPDEFADEFFSLVGEVEQYPAELDAEIIEIRKIFDSMQGIEEFWNNDALGSRLEWHNVRQLAKRFLNKNGEPLTPPPSHWCESR